MDKNIVLGVDVGGTGIKGALVDVKAGKLVADRFRLATPRPSNPSNVAEVFKKIVAHFDWKGPIGCGFPAVMKNGVSLSASNIHEDWVGADVAKIFSEASGCQVFMVNDADAAGIAELKFGEGKGRKGTVILITIGTGLGSAVFTDGHLVSNTEFGHLYLKGHKKIAEKYASNAAREKDDLSWEEWAKRFKKYLKHLQFIFTPDLFILGGGASKKFDNYKDKLDIRTPIVTAKMLNEAGIIGAAIRGHELSKEL